MWKILSALRWRAEIVALWARRFNLSGRAPCCRLCKCQKNDPRPPLSPIHSAQIDRCRSWTPTQRHAMTCLIRCFCGWKQSPPTCAGSMRPRHAQTTNGASGGDRSVSLTTRRTARRLRNSPTRALNWSATRTATRRSIVCGLSQRATRRQVAALRRGIASILAVLRTLAETRKNAQRWISNTTTLEATPAPTLKL